jgi:murein DD-endopeptidase MepM/ murein hydrolase activator NlpD
MNTIDVPQGAKVKAGQQIATIGNRGQSTGPHLHFEVWLGGSQKINPVGWLAERGVTL